MKRKNAEKIDIKKLPEHIAIIPDGNGRWAKRRGLPRSIGHREGGNVIEKITRYAGDIGIKYLTFYVFSTENWKREKKEIDFIMGLLKDFLDNAEEKIGGRDIKIRVIGNYDELSDELIESIKNIEERTRNNSNLVLVIALNYGGRKELTDAVKRIVSDKENDDKEITEELLSDYLYTKGMPDPDLLIRTSGEYRSSNFLIWQMAYTEYYFTKVLWPNFRKKDLDLAIVEYQKRKRRYGGNV